MSHAVARSADDWRDFLRAHMPPGDALDLAEGSLFYRHFSALSIELARFDALIDQLLAELDPRTTNAFLPEWERYLALPRACQVTPPTGLAERRAAIAEVILRGADISKATLIESAALYGFTITIREYFPETDPADLPLSNAFRYDVSGVTGAEFILFRAGQSSSGDRLGASSELGIECLLDEIEPAYAERTIL